MLSTSITLGKVMGTNLGHIEQLRVINNRATKMGAQEGLALRDQSELGMYEVDYTATHLTHTADKAEQRAAKQVDRAY